MRIFAHRFSSLLSATLLLVVSVVFSAQVVSAQEVEADASEVNYELVSAETYSAAEACSGCCECSQACPPAASAPSFGGCSCCRSKLTGDWGGQRTCMATNGITFDADETLVYSGVASGGRRREFLFSGHGDYVFNFDFGKMGVQEGLFLKVRAEHRYGQNIANSAGTILSPNLITSLPDPSSEDLMITDFFFTQALSESFALIAGKLDTLDGDQTSFASGRGKTQFMNTSFVFNPAMARTVPYSTLGAGFALLAEGQPWAQFMVLNSQDTSDTAGFDELFEKGCVLSASAYLPTEFFGLPGHQMVGGAWSSQDYTSLGQDPRVILPQNNIPIAEQSGSWALMWNMDQFFVVDPCNPKQGWGMFGRAAITDANPNPIAYFLSAGIGGNSWIRGREMDTFGVGYYYSGASDDLGPIATNLLGVSDGNGVELFYNYAYRPWCHITPDLQFIQPGSTFFDPAVLLGLRANISF